MHEVTTSRRMRRSIVVVSVLLVALSALSIRLFVFPATAPAGPTDAVVLLAGAPEMRLPLAVELAEEGPGVLVVSAAGGEVNTPSRTLCEGNRDLDVTVICFTPDEPQNTRAEARAIADLVEEQDWSRITVVTSTYHVQRAGLLVGRCTDAEVAVAAARPQLSAVDWGGHVLREMAGLAGAAFSRSC